MFTGIIEGQGMVRSAGARLVLDADGVAGDARVGESVAVNGVCLTVTERRGDDLAFDLASETLTRTSLGALRAGDRVNLERPVTLATRLGGHLVQGHVDGVGTVEGIEDEIVTVRVPDGLGRYVVEKGSIAVDGVSLTVAGIRDGTFSVSLVPHTRSVTTLGALRPGDPVNLEVDVVAKYVEGFLRRDR